MRLEPVGDTLAKGGGQALTDWAQWIHVVWHHSDHTPPPPSVQRLPAWGGDAKQHFLVELAPGRQGRDCWTTHWSICAENTRKETNKQYTMWFIVWLLCAVDSTPLWRIDVLLLLVGHTHNKLDSFVFTNCCGVGRAGLLHCRRHVAAVAVQLVAL